MVFALRPKRKGERTIIIINQHNSSKPVVAKAHTLSRLFLRGARWVVSAGENWIKFSGTASAAIQFGTTKSIPKSKSHFSSSESRVKVTTAPFEQSCISCQDAPWKRNEKEAWKCAEQQVKWVKVKPTVFVYVIRPSFWVVEQLGVQVVWASASLHWCLVGGVSSLEPLVVLTVKLHLVKWSPTVNWLLGIKQPKEALLRPKSSLIPTWQCKIPVPLDLRQLKPEKQLLTWTIIR